MAIPDPVSKQWPADRALLLVHGIGNAKEGDYAAIEAQLAGILAAAKKPYAIYVLYYDYLNDWFAGKEQVGTLDQVLRDQLRTGGAELGQPTREWNTAVDFIGDILWPVLLVDAREAVQVAVRRQLLQMVLDGRAAGFDPVRQHLSIIAHSMGCFHTFETLHAIVRDPQSRLRPAGDGVVFDNVVFMAPPVQMIGTCARGVRAVVPSPAGLSCTAQPLVMPGEPSPIGPQASVRRPVTITGNLDPVGGYLFRHKFPWAHMDLSGDPTAVCIDDPQTPLNINSVEELETILAQSLQAHARPEIGERHPHSWFGYIDRHRAQLLTWLDVP